MSTELALIPTDWHDLTLGDLSDKITVGFVGSMSHLFTTAGVPLLRGTNVFAGKLDLRDMRYISNATHQKWSKSSLETGDIVIVRVGDPGRSALIPPSFAVANAASLLIVRADRKRLNPAYAMQVLNSDTGRRRIEGELVGGAQQVFNTRLAARYHLPLPPRAEQDRIVDILCDADELMESLIRQIAKRRSVKQGLMQQLLTGRTRLANFRASWVAESVAAMGIVLAGKALNATGAGELRPYLRTKNVLDGRIDLSDILRMPMTDAEFERFAIQRGDVLLNEGQSLDLVGRCALYDEEFGMPCAIQNQLLCFRAYKRTCPEFAAQLFRFCQSSGAFASIATQTTSVAHLGRSRFNNLRLMWPTDRAEQAAIAGVLVDADRDIAELGSRLEKARAIKRGMAQQLLTGRTRLPVAESAA